MGGAGGGGGGGGGGGIRGRVIFTTLAPRVFACLEVVEDLTKPLHNLRILRVS
tara:strand:+ start:376 stop:534 length:159 start_codon:yes stop_codon:yes gene_type:complete